MTHLCSYLSLFDSTRKSSFPVEEVEREEETMGQLQLLPEVDNDKVKDDDNKTLNKNDGDDNDPATTCFNKEIIIKKARKENNKSSSFMSPFLAHSNFHFDFDPVQSDPGVETNLINFFDQFGHQIHQLKYTTDLIPLNFPKRLPHMGNVWGRDRLPNLETLYLEIKWGCPAFLFEYDDAQVRLPSVKILILDILIGTEREAERAAIFLKQLLSATPNVEEICIPGKKKNFILQSVD